MKQYINKDQLSELSLGGQKRLHSWFIRNQQPGEVYKLFHPTDLDNEKPSVSMMCTDIENCPTIILNEKYDPELEYPQHENWECLPLLSIGQMIEFLDESGEYSFLNVHSEVLGLPHNWGVGIIKNFNLCDGWVENEYIIKYQENVELCDALWEAVKKELEK